MTNHDSAELEMLLGQAKLGDQSAVGKLFELYRHYLRLLARVQIDRKLQGKVSPSDVVQDCFLQAQKDLPDFQGKTAAQLIGWLRQILATKLAKLVRHYFKTQRRNVRLEQQIMGDIDQSSQALAKVLPTKESSPSQKAARHEEALLLANAMDRLPADYRDVLVLRHFEELTFSEVSERMGRSLASVEKLWTRALARLRRILRDSK